MKALEKELANRLCYLPVSILGRVELWLTYKGAKPASSIVLRNPYNPLNSKTKRILKWTEDAKLSVVPDSKNHELVHVSKDFEIAKKMSKHHLSEKAQHIKYRGIMYGYPKEAVAEYANANLNKLTVADLKNFDKKVDYWKPYCRYLIRSSQVLKDSQVAVKWANIIRKDTPKLSMWYEKAVLKSNSQA